MKFIKPVVLNLISLIYILLSYENCWAQNWNQCGAPIKFASPVNVINGNLYTCGLDTSLQSSMDRKIAFYDGVTWDTLLGKTYDGGAYAFEYFNGNLYVGGRFKHIGDSIQSMSQDGIRNLARWDGMKFDSIGAFPVSLWSGEVWALQVYNNELYVGGSFLNAAGQNIACIARYDGSSWYPLGSGLTGTFRTVYSMTIFNGDLIVAGTFYTAGGVPAENIARWDGNQWYPMGNGLSPHVFCVLVDSISNTLYASGNIGGSGATPISYVAKWDGQNWQQVGNGLPATSWGMSMYQGILYAGTRAPVPNKIMRLIGQTWQPLATYPTNGGISELCEFQGALFAGATFYEIDSICCFYGLAKYSDTLTVGFNNENQNDFNFNIYPNPAKDRITISLNNMFYGKSEIKLFNAYSELVFQKTFTDNTSEIELKIPEHLVSGVYICTIVNSGHEYSKSFILEKE